MRIVVIAATVLAVFSATNLVYQIVRKPTEMLFPVTGAMNKMPAETWRQYAPLFREYSTATIAPELLAALAQVEGAGNPVARTYWHAIELTAVFLERNVAAILARRPKVTASL
jgi:hypothetical protein